MVSRCSSHPLVYLKSLISTSPTSFSSIVVFFFMKLNDDLSLLDEDVTRLINEIENYLIKEEKKSIDSRKKHSFMRICF